MGTKFSTYTTVLNICVYKIIGEAANKLVENFRGSIASLNPSIEEGDVGVMVMGGAFLKLKPARNL